MVTVVVLLVTGALMSAVPIAKFVGAWLPVTWFPVAVVSVVPVVGVAVVW